MRRMLCLDFETGRITAWGKVPGGPAHRFGVQGPYDTSAMREWPFDREQLEDFRLHPTEFSNKQRQRSDAPEPGPEAA